ncbi:MAG: hypothetical protein ABI592_09115 [Acidobacteriota bacterium]
MSTSFLFALLHVQAGVPVSSAATVVLTSGILFGVLMLRWQSNRLGREQETTAPR